MGAVAELKQISEFSLRLYPSPTYYFSVSHSWTQLMPRLEMGSLHSAI